MSIATISKYTITVESSAITKDAAGGEVRTWTARNGLSGVRASIQNKGGNTVTQFAQRGITITHAIYSEADMSACEIGDRVTDDTGQRYVVRMASDMGGQRRIWSLLVDLLPPN